MDGIVSTLMLCETPAGVMDQEAAYTRALGEATSYDLAGDRLELNVGQAEALLEMSSNLIAI